jgi:hypothetical protein
MASQVGHEGLGRLGCGDRLGGEAGGQSVLPVLVLALDLALGLRGAGVTQRDAVEVEGGPELDDRVGALGEEQAVAVDIKFQRQAVLDEGRG